MSMAIIVHKAANTVVGGSLDGYLSGTSAAAINTFYGRRLTHLLVNESTGGVPTVNTFTASTGGTGAASTPGFFTLVPGTYRISVRAILNGTATDAAFIFGLFNVTTGFFEVYSGTTTPILGTPAFTTTNTIGNMQFVIEAGFTVATTNKTYQLSQEGRETGSGTTSIRNLNACGYPTTMTGTNVNSAAAENTYCIVKLLKTA